jgi:heterodisulfide reductase subunit A2
MTTHPGSDKRIGVYVCYCGGNISDYVDVQKVAEAVRREPGVTVSRTHMFTCSDAAQQEIIQDIKEQKLDGLVIASCSPKLHMFTFRGMAERAGLNPYQYIQVNLREQCSWAHTQECAEATEKGIALVKAGIAKAHYTEPLAPIRVNTKPSVLVVGGGITGLAAAQALSDLGLAVEVVEKSDRLGGWTAEWERVYPGDRDGGALVRGLVQDLGQRANVRLWTQAEVTEKGGHLGEFEIALQTPNGRQTLSVGAIVAATGFDPYEPRAGEFGFGLPEVMTLADFKRRLGPGQPLTTAAGKPVKKIAYIYCVGSRQKKSAETRANTHCSRYCCTAACYSSVSVHAMHPEVMQYHLFRDLRTFGEHELLYEQARKEGAVFLRYDGEEPPRVESTDQGVLVKVKDQLTAGELLEIPADLVVLVTGMQPRKNEELINVLKVPIGSTGFFNEIHPKLRPVETVMDGIFIAGAAQSPRLIGEAVTSALAAVSKCGALLQKGYVDLEPLIALVHADRCEWCGLCQPVCPYRAIERVSCDGKDKAQIIPFLCKGCGACVPVCPKDAIDVKGYSDEQITSVISALAEAPTP